MSSYYMKCRKNTESKNPNFVEIKNRKCFYQNLKCAIAKDQNLSKSKKLVDY